MQLSPNYWVFKSEPDAFGILDLQKEKNQTTSWEGVRNYQARNFLRDTVKKGDYVFFHHSNAKPSGIVGLCIIAKSAYPDASSWDTFSPYYDPKSSQKNPRWFTVDVKLCEIWPQMLSLNFLRNYTELHDLSLLRKGQRLSILPILKTEFDFIQNLAKNFK